MTSLRPSADSHVNFLSKAYYDSVKNGIDRFVLSPGFTGGLLLFCTSLAVVYFENTVVGSYTLFNLTQISPCSCVSSQWQYKWRFLRASDGRDSDAATSQFRIP